MRPKKGDTVDDRYELVELLGEGGQGSVWRARDRLSEAPFVAVKIVDITDDEVWQRARRETAHLVGLEHPALVKVERVFEVVGRQVAGWAMELVEGCTLAEALHDERLDLRQKKLIAWQLANVLAAVHEAGVVHRDVKPSNVMLTDKFWSSPGGAGTVKLVDFGLAVGQQDAQITKTGTTMGTARYMSPERLLALDTAGDPAVDVFSWGVLVWEMFVGGHPAGADQVSTAAQLAVRYQDLKNRRDEGWLAGIERADVLAGVLHRALRLRPEDRWKDAGDLVRALEPLVGAVVASSGTVRSTTEPHRAPEASSAVWSEPGAGEEPDVSRSVSSRIAGSSHVQLSVQQQATEVSAAAHGTRSGEVTGPERVGQGKPAWRRRVVLGVISLLFLSGVFVAAVVVGVLVIPWDRWESGQSAEVSSTGVLEPTRIDIPPSVFVPKQPKPPHASEPFANQNPKKNAAGYLCPDDLLWLQLIGIQRGSEDLFARYPKAIVCVTVRRSGDKKCMRLSIVNSSNPDKIKLRGEDLVSQGIDLDIWEDNGLSHKLGHRSMARYTDGMACTIFKQGIIMRKFGTRDTVTQVNFVTKNINATCACDPM